MGVHWKPTPLQCNIIYDFFKHDQLHKKVFELIICMLLPVSKMFSANAVCKHYNYIMYNYNEVKMAKI